MDLAKKHCKPCEGGVRPLNAHMELRHLNELDGWILHRHGEHKISKDYKFKTFESVMSFVNKVAAIASEEDHHPDIHIHYNEVSLELWTHAIGGLSENDFIVAAKIDKLGL